MLEGVRDFSALLPQQLCPFLLCTSRAPLRSVESAQKLSYCRGSWALPRCQERGAGSEDKMEAGYWVATQEMPGCSLVWPAPPTALDLGREGSKETLPTWQPWAAGECGSLGM